MIVVHNRTPFRLRRAPRHVYLGDVFRHRRDFLLLGIVSLLLGSATSLSPASVAMGSTGSPTEAGQLVRVEPIGSYEHFTLRLMLWWYGFANVFPTEHGISLFRVEYGTTAPDGRIVVASGLLALPRGDEPWRGVVSWQHGTASLSTAAPSSLDAGNGLLPAIAFAGNGYVLVAPDYLGFGVSTEPHAYYHTPSIVAATVDMLRASQSWLRARRQPLPDALMLAGFSQGGHATLATARALEAEPLEELRLTAAASIAGPLDLAGVALPESLLGRSRFASLYIAWIATTYAQVYREDPSSVLRDPWTKIANEVLDGKHDGNQIVVALPMRPRTLLSESLAVALDRHQPHWFVDRLRENSVNDWIPKSPLRLYYGDRDVDVPHADAVTFAERARAAGADVVVTSVGDVDHDASVVAAAPLLRSWFNSLTASGSQ